MRFTSVFVALSILLVTPGVFTSPALKSIQTYNGETSGKYIVELRPDVSRADWIRRLDLANGDTVEWDVINGFAGQ